jgi:SNF2 family DNA or RNA helicase
MLANAELNEAGNRIDVTFPYDPNAVLAIKRVPGARFVPKDKGGPLWRMPLDLTSARMLREQFGDGLTLGPRVKRWGHIAVRKETNLTRLGAQDDAELVVLPKKLPLLMKAINGEPIPELKLGKDHNFSKKRTSRPYQRADIAFLAQADAINANEPGLGKTLEVIGAVFEAELDNGPLLVLAPKTSLESVWVAELCRWQPHPVLTTSGDDSKAKREEVIAEAAQLAAEEKPFWLVLNPHMVRYERDRSGKRVVEEGREQYPLVSSYPALMDIEWNCIAIDEYHKMGLANPKPTLMTKAVKNLKRQKLILMSGTPMGGKPLKLWAALHMVDPGKFTSKWRWAEQWLDIAEIEAAGEMHKVIEGIRADRENDFYREHAPYLLRRTKAEVLTQLPPKQRIVVPCDMTPAQRKQYESIASDVEIKIDTERLTVTGVLAEYTRLKQFSNAKQTIKHMGNGDLILSPVQDSGKLPQLLRLLEERGISKDEKEGTEQVVIFSQYSSMADMLTDWLNEQGIPTAKITGAVNRKGERNRLVEEFQSDSGPRVMCMTTGAGGVSITLDRASTVIFIDETWDPDDQTQAEDRVHRGSRMHQVMCYYLRSTKSIEEHIANITGGKRLTNDQVLDLHRILAKEAGVAA